MNTTNISVSSKTEISWEVDNDTSFISVKLSPDNSNFIVIQQDNSQDTIVIPKDVAYELARILNKFSE